MTYDTIIVGGGPAGLSAALVLGRCRRSVLVVDAGRGRNYATRQMHNYLTRDGIEPALLRRLGRQELRRYGVEVRNGTVTAAKCRRSKQPAFEVHVGSKTCVTSRTLLLATGVVDQLPDIPNVKELYGRGVHHCPYCDAWGYRDKAIAAYGRGSKGVGLAMSLLTWTPHVTVVTGGAAVPRAARLEASRLGIAIREEKISRLQGASGRARPTKADVLATIVFDRGDPLAVAAMFFNTDQWQRSALPRVLGCRMTPEGGVLHDRRQRTGVPGLYLAGDASRDVQFAIVAAAEGAKAGVAINGDLELRDRAEQRARAR